jgi:hypothetical protein
MNCRMYVKQTIQPGQVAFTKLTHDPSVDLTECNMDATSLISNELELQFVGTKDGAVNFIINDKVSGELYPINIDLRYWKGY